MKKLIALLLALTMIFTLSCPAYAATVEMAKTAVETMRGKQLETNIHDLLESYKATDDANEQVVIFNELVACYSELDEMEFYHSDIAPLASNYVTIIGTPSVSNNKATIEYKVNMAIPNGATVSVGFEYPGAWRQSSPSIIAKSAVGTYSQTISTTIMMGARYFTKLVANSYTEKQTYMTYYGGLTKDGPAKTVFDTVEASDVMSNLLATTIATNVVVWLIGGSDGGIIPPTAVKYTLKGLEILFDACQISNVKPLCERQYVKYESKIVGDTLHVTVSRYPSKADYSTGGSPLETVSMSYSFTGYPTN